MKTEEIKRNYMSHELDVYQEDKIAGIKYQARKLAQLVEEMCPDGREKSLAHTKLEEATMWATAAIARYRDGR